MNLIKSFSDSGAAAHTEASLMRLFWVCIAVWIVLFCGMFSVIVHFSLAFDDEVEAGGVLVLMNLNWCEDKMAFEAQS